MTSDKAEGRTAPADATEAVLRPSDPIPQDAREVKGIDFNRFHKHKLTVEELVEQMAYMGFQATSVGEATRIINEMASKGTVTLPSTLETNRTEGLERRGDI